MKYRVVVTSLFACASFLSPAAAVAQSGWPTEGDLETYGLAIPDDELATLLSENVAVIGFAVGASSFGLIVSCSGGKLRMIQFDSPFSSTSEGTCRIADSTLCTRASGDDYDECFRFNRLPGVSMIFVAPVIDDADEIPEEERADLLDRPATAVGIAPLDLDALYVASGDLDFGPFSITLPDGLSLYLNDAVGHPMSFVFGDKSGLADFGLIIEFTGWPDPLTAASAQAGVGDRQRELRTLFKWEEGYRNRDLGGWMETTYRLDRYQADPVVVEHGSCLRISEIVAVDSNSQGWTIRPAESWYTRQICVSGPAGVMMLVSVSRHDPPDNLTPDAADAFAARILDSISLGWNP